MLAGCEEKLVAKVNQVTIQSCGILRSSYFTVAEREGKIKAGFPPMEGLPGLFIRAGTS